MHAPAALGDCPDTGGVFLQSLRCKRGLGPTARHNALLTLPHGISLQFRGGPQKYEVTAWLQIQAVRVTDEGTYRCFARNKVGQAMALASLTVLTPGKRGFPSRGGLLRGVVGQGSQWGVRHMGIREQLL